MPPRALRPRSAITVATSAGNGVRRRAGPRGAAAAPWSKASSTSRSPRNPTRTARESRCRRPVAGRWCSSGGPSDPTPRRRPGDATELELRNIAFKVDESTRSSPWRPRPRIGLVGASAEYEVIRRWRTCAAAEGIVRVRGRAHRLASPAVECAPRLHPGQHRRTTTSLNRRPEAVGFDRRRLVRGGPRGGPRARTARPACAPRRAATGPPCRPRPSRASGRSRGGPAGGAGTRRRLAAEQPGQAELDGRRVEQVAAADDEVDAVPHVVDDHAERVRPVAHPVAHEQIAGRRRLVGHRPRQQVDPALRARPDRHPQARAPVLGERPRPAPARAPDPAPRPPALRLVRGERRPRAVAGVHEPVRRAAGRARPRRRRPRPTGDRASGRARNAASGRLVGREAQPLQVVEHRRLELGPRPLPVVVLDPQHDPPARRPGDAPRVQRVDEVPEVEVARSAPGANRVTGDAGSTRGSGRAPPVTAGTNSASPSARHRRPVSRRVAVMVRSRSRGRGCRRRSGGRSTAGRPGRSGPRWPSRRAAAPRARAPGRGPRAGPRAASPARRRGPAPRAR